MRTYNYIFTTNYVLFYLTLFISKLILSRNVWCTYAMHIMLAIDENLVTMNLIDGVK